MTRDSRPPGRDARDGPVTAPGRSRKTTPPPTTSQQKASPDSSLPRGTAGGRSCAAPGCDRRLPAGRRRFCCDLCRVRVQRAERIARAMARRLGVSDDAVLAAQYDERAAVAAALGLRAKGLSWEQLGAAWGLSAYQWRGRHPRRSGVNKTRQRNPDDYRPEDGQHER
jgi:hypothetical protein